LAAKGQAAERKVIWPHRNGRIDRQIKVPDYRRIPSVEEILLIDCDSIFAEVLRRDGDRWMTEIVRGREATSTLASVPATLSMAQLYEGIALPDPQTRRAGAG
jgi:Uma2 family endonuclease